MANNRGHSKDTVNCKETVHSQQKPSDDGKPETNEGDHVVHIDEVQQTKHPIDSGWAWVVLFGTMLNSFIMNGTLKSFSILYVEFLHNFESSDAAVSIIQSIQTVVYSLGSICSLTFGLKFMSCRQSVLLGGVFLSLCYLCSSFAENVPTLYFTYSCFYGLGFAFGFSPSLVVLSSYFNKHRGLSNGLLMASGSLGALAIAPFTRFIIDQYLLRGGLLILSGIALNVTVAGALMRPPSFYSKLTYRKNDCKETIEHKVDQMELGKQSMSTENTEKVVVIASTMQDGFKKEEGPLISKKSVLTQENDLKTENKIVCKGDEVPSNSQDDINICENKTVVQSDAIHNRRHTKKQACIAQVKQSIESVFNRKVLNNKAFLRLLFAYSLGTAGNLLPIYYVPAYANEHNINDQDAAILVTIYGVFDVIGRTVAGFVSDRKILKRQYLIALGLSINAVCQLCAPFYTDYITLLVFSVIYGLFGGNLAAIYAPTLLDILPAKDFRSALCFMYIGQGISIGATSPIVGVLRDVSGTYVSCFFFFGGLLVMAASFLWIEAIPCPYQKKGNN